MKAKALLTANFEAHVVELRGQKLIHIPQEVSEGLASRGMNFGHITLVKHSGDRDNFKGPLEPDGQGGHWFLMDAPDIQEYQVGETLSIAINELLHWPSPQVAEDFLAALVTSNLLSYYQGLTSKAQWEWIRWLRMTDNELTRQKRIAASLDKMKQGMKRPCCFDQTRCTDYRVCKNGKLL